MLSIKQKLQHSAIVSLIANQLPKKSVVFCFIAVIYQATKGIYSIKKHQGYYYGDVPLPLNRVSSCADLIEESYGIAAPLWRTVLCAMSEFEWKCSGIHSVSWQLLTKQHCGRRYQTQKCRRKAISVWRIINIYFTLTIFFHFCGVNILSVYEIKKYDDYFYFN